MDDDRAPLEQRRAAWRAINKLGGAYNPQALANHRASGPTKFRFIGVDVGRDVTPNRKARRARKGKP